MLMISGEFTAVLMSMNIVLLFASLVKVLIPDVNPRKGALKKINRLQASFALFTVITCIIL